MEHGYEPPVPDALMPLVNAALTKSDAPPVVLTPEEREARAKAEEDATARYIRDARREDNRRRWELACPAELKTSDWAHPRLAPYSAAIQRVLAYEVGKKGIVASGPTGRGKTRSMWQLMRRLGEEGRDVRYWNAIDWFTTLQENVKYGRDDARGWVESVARRHIVFLDDLGQEAVQLSRADWSRAWFFRFLDIRVGEGLPLFVTTNLTADAMAGRETTVRGDPLVRRLLDLCDTVKFEASA